MARQRLTISLRPEVVKLLDKAIDGEKIRNRSHAVEFLLSEHLRPHAVQALILAGGEPVLGLDRSQSLPKCMLQYQSRPILEHTLLNLKQQGFFDVVISIGPLGDLVKKYFGDGAKLGLKIRYLEQVSGKVGSAPPLLEAQELLSSQEFLLIYGDVLASVSLSDLLEFHHAQKGAIVSAALTSVEQTSLWGVAQLSGVKISAFQEKPQTRVTRSHLVSAGVAVMSPAVFKFLSSHDLSLERDVFPRLVKDGKLFGYVFEGGWLDAVSLLHTTYKAA